MIPSEIIQKAIRKAVENGWDMFDYRNGDKEVVWTFTMPTMIIQTVDEDGNCETIDSFRVNDLLCSKSFNQHLWNHEPYYMMEAKYQHEFNPDGTNKSIEFRAGGIWEFRMVQILLAEDPVKKLGELLEL